MDIVIDGKRGLVGVGSGGTFAGIFETIQKFCASKGRIITSVSLDGKELSAGRREALKAVASDGKSVLQVVTADAREFSLGTLEELDSLVAQLEKLHEATSGHVIAGAYRDAMLQAEGCFQGWQMLIGTVRDLGVLLNVNFTTLQVGGQSVDARFVRVKDAFQKFTDAFARQDGVRLGDIIQHELRPLLADWRTVIDALRRPAGGGKAS